MRGKTIGEMKVGESAHVEKTISESDVYLFAGITGDFNPAHVNKVEAEKSRFGRRDRPRHATAQGSSARCWAPDCRVRAPSILGRN